MGTVRYAEEHFNWIRDNFDLYSNSLHMANAFEQKFNMSMRDTTMRALWTRLGLRKNNQHRYTPEEDLWLSENANTIPYSKLTEQFNAKFGTNVTMGALNQHCITYLGIYSDNPNEFNNRIPWNKLALGTERIDKRTGSMLVKTEKGWINKARYVYEQAHGEIPKDHQVIFLDSDHLNFDLANLYCIPTKYMLLMNRNNWCTEDREITLAAIKYCELYYMLEENKL